MPNAIERLKHILRAQTALLPDFVSVLRDEASLLAAGRALEGLDVLADRKLSLAQQLSDLDSARERSLAEAGYASGRAGLDQAMVDHPHLREASLGLYDLASQAASINADNGRLIALLHRRNTLALQELHRLLGNDTLYDAKGHSNPAAAASSRFRAG